MSEQEKKNLNQETANSTAEEMALMIEGLYNGIVASLKKLKGEICNEMKYSALQINGYCETVQQEATQMVAKNHAMILAVSKELKYGYQQNQMIHEDLVHLINDDLFSKIEEWAGKVDAVSEKIEVVSEKFEFVSEIEKIIPAIEEASKALTEKIEALKDNDELLEKIKEIVAGTYETVDYAKINDMIDSSVIKAENSIIEQTQEIVENATIASAEQSQQILNAINAIEVPEAVDYTRIVEEVSERVLELLREEFTVYQEEVIDEELEEEILEDEVEEEVEETEELVEEVSEEVEEETTEEVAPETEETEEEIVEPVEETVVADEVVETVEETEEEVVEEIVEKPVVTEIDYDRIVERTAEKVVESLPFVEKIDYKQIEEMIQAVVLDVVVLADEVADKVVEKLPQPEAPEAIDYERIAEVVAETVPAPEMIDYERLSETVVSKIPAPEAVDYDRLAETVLAKMPAPEAVDYDRLAETVLAKMPAPEAVDYDRLAETVLAKMPAPEAVDYDRLAETVLAKVPAPEAIDYEALSDMIVSKMPKPVEPAPVDYETLAEMVAAKMVAPTYDVVLDAEGIENVALGVCENLNVTALAEMVVEKLNYEQLADMVAERLAVKVEFVSEPIIEVEETVEEVTETTEEVQEEVVEETVAEETVEEVEEVVTEEATEEPVDEIAVAQAPEYMEEGDELVDAETGMVVRLKRSFTAKLKQSDEEVKVFYDMIKNELASYKKVKSTVSWHGDRFNLGRATVAKINICGKTLCFYVALNPDDPELKTTVYHQKNVGDQKAYQATPFKVKIKSEMGAKRAIRLVSILAEKIGAVKKPDYVATDYVEEFAYETTKELLDKGLIKETKEKKIAFEF